MMKYKLLFLIVISMSFLSCEGTVNELVGTWDYTQSVTLSCSNSNSNITIDYSGNGDCDPLSSILTCTNFSLRMDDINYTLREITTIGDEENSIIIEEGTYKIVTGDLPTIQFCTDVLCTPKVYDVINKNTLRLESEDSNTGCITTITAERR